MDDVVCDRQSVGRSESSLLYTGQCDSPDGQISWSSESYTTYQGILHRASDRSIGEYILFGTEMTSFRGLFEAVYVSSMPKSCKL
jgi:hypothetical protein